MYQARLQRLLKNSVSARFVSGHAFSRADKLFIFVIPSGLQPARDLLFRLFQQPVQACHKGRKINAPLGAGFSVRTFTTRCECARNHNRRQPLVQAGAEPGEAWSGGSAGTVALEQLPRLCLPGARTSSGERLERARAESSESRQLFHSHDTHPGLEKRETRGTRK